MRPLINTKFNYDHTRYGEVNSQPSMTIPNDTMSLRQMLDRYARGMALPERPLPYYDEENVFPNMAKMDLTERADYLESQKEKVLLLQKQLEDERKQPSTEPLQDAPQPPAHDTSAPTLPTPDTSPDAK